MPADDMPTAEQFRETAKRFKFVIDYGLTGILIGDNEVARAALACDIAADILEGRRTELDSALNKLTTVILGRKSPQEAAWWLCANHARFIIDHPNLVEEGTMIALAAMAGTPPKGENWRDWFDRVRNLPRSS